MYELLCRHSHILIELDILFRFSGNLEHAAPCIFYVLFLLVAALFEAMKPYRFLTHIVIRNEDFARIVAFRLCGQGVRQS